MSINVVIVGAAGRMGKTIIRCLQEQRVEGLQLSGAVDLWDSQDLGQDAGLSAGGAESGVSVTADLAEVVGRDADVLIDFSSHQGTQGNAHRIAEWKKPWVIGTTGLSNEERAEVERAAENIPVVMAPNMSLGVNLLFALAKQAAGVLKGKGFDVEITEMHHRRKKDAPSGTALGLGKAVAEGMGWDLDRVARHGREGIDPSDRPEEQIGFHSLRGGNIVGDHTVLFAADGESIELSHRSTNRETFALGALRAAKWVVGRKPGLYTMQDVLGLADG